MDLTLLGKEPIAPELPAGRDVRYDPLFDRLQAEVDRTSLPAVAGAVDWEKVVALCAEILGHKCKDLLVASYLAVGLIHTRRIEGLALALKIYRDLVEHHGASLFPRRQRARLRCLEWWLERCALGLKPLEGYEVHPALAARMEEDLARLENLFSELLPAAPPLQPLREFVTHLAKAPLVEDAGAAETALAPAPAVSSTQPAVFSPDIDLCRVPGSSPLPSPSRVAAALSSPAAAAPGDNRDAVEDSLRRLRATAKVLRDRDLCDPVSYRFSRQACWLSVNAPPPASLGRTRLSPPPAALGERLESLSRDGRPAALLGELEAMLSQYIFWFDLNRMVVAALSRLDGSRAAVAAVCEETAFLVRRLPGVDGLAFADGTPFAAGDTRLWLRRLLDDEKCGADSPAPVPDRVAAQNTDLVAPKMEEVGDLVVTGRLIEAFELFQAGIGTTRSGRERLAWRLALSRVLMQADRVNLALPFLEQLVLDIDHHGLETYEPAIALEGLKLAWYGFHAQKNSLKAEAILHRIACINLVEMVHLTEG